jgi:hypothetical protein
MSSELLTKDLKEKTLCVCVYGLKLEKILNKILYKPDKSYPQ